MDRHRRRHPAGVRHHSPAIRLHEATEKFAIHMLAPSKTIPIGSLNPPKMPSTGAIAGAQLGYSAVTCVRYPNGSAIESDPTSATAHVKPAKRCAVAGPEFRNCSIQVNCYPHHRAHHG